MPLHVSSTRAHHQEVKIVSHSLWYYHTYRWSSRAQVERGVNPNHYSNATVKRCLYRPGQDRKIPGGRNSQMVNFSVLGIAPPPQMYSVSVRG